MEPLHLALERLDCKRPSVVFAKARLRTPAGEFDVDHGKLSRRRYRQCVFLASLRPKHSKDPGVGSSPCAADITPEAIKWHRSCIT